MEPFLSHRSTQNEAQQYSPAVSHNESSSLSLSLTYASRWNNLKNFCVEIILHKHTNNTEYDAGRTTMELS